MLRSFTVEPVIAAFKAAAAVCRIEAVVEVGDFGAYMQEALDAASRIHASRPDVIVVALQTRDLAPELWTRFAELGAEEIDRCVERVIADFTALIRALRQHSGAHLVVHNLEQPVRPTLGQLDLRSEFGQHAAIRHINDAIARLARAERGVYVLDYDSLVARHGRVSWYDEAKWYSMRMPIAAQNVVLVANEWLRLLHPLCGRLCKVLVTDLDNTLWGGVVGEDGPNGIKLGVEYPGATYTAIQRALLALHQRGILLAIASKNNMEDAREVIDRHPEMLVRNQHFAALRINWNDKAQSLREIAAELNLGLDALAFLDDNPVERQWVQEQLPEVTVLDLPEDPLGWADAVLSAPVFERLQLSAEDRERTKYYAADRERQELQRGAASLEDFLRSLELNAEIGPVDVGTLPRVAQLTQKTNQFNVSTRRYTEQALEVMSADPSWQVLWMRARDRFGDHGIVGVSICHVDGDRGSIDTFLLSCRVIGRTLETALLARICEWARERGARRLTGWFRPSAKNAPARDFFPNHGFALVEENEGASLWSLDLGSTAIATPNWIQCSAPQGK
ncbi:MAG: HAD-IIIC family phosphatase [Myxococcota bacterium]